MIRYVLPGAEPKTDWDIGKREIERDHLSYFLDSHRRATGEKIEIVAESETPDFIGRDADGNSVGIELTSSDSGRAAHAAHLRARAPRLRRLMGVSR